MNEWVNFDRGYHQAQLQVYHFHIYRENTSINVTLSTIFMTWMSICVQACKDRKRLDKNLSPTFVSTLILTNSDSQPPHDII